MGGNCGNMAVCDCVGCGIYHTSPDSLDQKGICEITGCHGRGEYCEYLGYCNRIDTGGNCSGSCLRLYTP